MIQYIHRIEPKGGNMGKLENSTRGFGSPSKYIQGPGELKNIKKYAKTFGKNLYILIDAFLYDSMKIAMESICDEEGDLLEIDRFGGEVCEEEIDRILNGLQNKTIDVVIAIGGGKTIDTAKVIAEEVKARIIVVPTAASTDAPTSALSVIYKKTGEHSHEAFLKTNPDIVLVDTEIIMNAPPRLLVSGMGDALATYFEARACKESRTANFIGKGFHPTLAGSAIAEACYKTLLEDGLEAKRSVLGQVFSEALENVVEANTLLSGLGFENTGCAAAHGIHDALTVLPETHSYYHGEKVSFGTICLLFLENRDKKEIEEVVDFCMEVGLPITLADIGIADISKEHLYPVAIEASKSFLLAAEPIEVSPERIFGAMILADTYGKYKKRV